MGFFNDNDKTKEGIDKLEMMAKFVDLIETDDEKKYHSFVDWLSIQIKRDLTNRERLNLSQAILKFLKSEEASKERLESMQYIFNTSFLN